MKFKITKGGGDVNLGSPALPKVADFGETMGLPLIAPFAGRIKDFTTTLSFFPGQTSIKHSIITLARLMKSESGEDQILAFLKNQISDLENTIVWACENANVVPVARILQMSKNARMQPMVIYFDKTRIADEIARTFSLADRGFRQILCICGGTVIDDVILVAQVTGLFKRSLSILFLDPRSDQAAESEPLTY